MSFEASSIWKAVAAVLFFTVIAFFITSSLAPVKAQAATLTVVAATTTTNNASTTLAKVGNTVTFGLQLSGTPAATSTPTINIFNMGTSSFTGSGAFWSYSTTSASSWTNGFLTFLMAWGGSLGESTTTVTQTALTGPNVRFDSVAPTISSITSSATCSRLGGTVCIPGDTITFTLTPGATEFGASVSGSYNGKSLSWSTANAGVTYTATYTVGGSDSSQPSPLQISGVIITDAAGNASGAGSGSDVAVKISASGGGSAVTTGTITCPNGTTYTISAQYPDLSVCSSSSSTSSNSASTNPPVTSPTTPSTPSKPASTPSTAAVATFARNLQVGGKGDDVMALQVFLNAHGFLIATSGPGSKGNETTTFGPKTKAALAKFQKANGISPAHGYFGPKTRALISGM